MSEFVRVTPAEGRIVRDLAGAVLPAEGVVLERALLTRSNALTYWARRERDGDVTITEAAEPSPIAAAAPAPVEE